MTNTTRSPDRFSPCPEHATTVTATEVAIIYDLAQEGHPQDLADFVCAVSCRLHRNTDALTRDTLAALIYDPHDQFLTTVDSTPNSYAYAAADRILAAGLALTSTPGDSADD